MSADNRYILIVAGGSGTRLYPRSRESRPKQFQPIIGKKTLIEETFERAQKIVDTNRIYISIQENYLDLAKEFLPEIPEENIIAEPMKRNTAPAMALATALISKRDPKAVIASLHSDHLVLRPKIFVNAIRAGFALVERQSSTIVTIGINPVSPHTGYGYIERGEGHEDMAGLSAYKALRFVEKPNKEKALEYLRTGRFYWNAGYFIWSARHLEKELKRLQPKMHAAISKIADSYGSPAFKKTLTTQFSKIPNTAIDHAIMEKTKRLSVIPADLGWSDVGSWDSVSELLDHDSKTPEGNYCEGLVIPIDTYNSVILSNSKDRLTATIGLDNIIVVQTDDALIISQKGRTEEVKRVVEELKKRKLDHLT